MKSDWVVALATGEEGVAMIFLYVVIGVVAVLVLIQQVALRQRNSPRPSIDRYHRALSALGEMSDHVRTGEAHPPAEPEPAHFEPVPPPVHFPSWPRTEAPTPQAEPVAPPPVLLPPTREPEPVAPPPVLLPLSLEPQPLTSRALSRTKRSFAAFIPVKGDRHEEPPPPSVPPTQPEAADEGEESPDEFVATSLGRRRLLVAGLGALVVAVVAAASLVAFLPSSPKSPPAATGTRTPPPKPAPTPIVTSEAMPNAVGLTTSKAEGIISAAGLRWHLVSVDSPTAAAAGTVLGELPTPTSTVDRGQVITLKIGAPFLQVAVPNVSNPPQRASVAEATLTAAGFVPSVNTVSAKTTSQIGQQGEVVSQSPAAGTATKKHSRVTIEVVGGAATVAIPPSVVGETPAQAGATLAGAQLAVGTTSTGSSLSVPAGEVASTSPSAPGHSVAVGSTVNLVISTGPPAVVPDLRGDTLATARHALRVAGLVLGSVNEGQGPAGVVVAQAARPGRTLHRGTAIAIVVGTTPPSSSSTSPPSGNTAANTPGT